MCPSAHGIVVAMRGDMTVKQAFYFLEGVKQYCHWEMLQAVNMQYW